jgi:hypothetical protein
MRRWQVDTAVKMAVLGGMAIAGCQHPPTEPIGGLPQPSASPTPATTASPTPAPSPTATPSASPSAPAGYRISTVAGNGIKGDSDPGRPATQTTLFSPTGVAVAADGSFYLADYKANKLRRVDANGILTNIAGNTTYPAEGGDEGPAINASLAKPYGVLIDPHGNVLFSEYGYSVPGSTILGKVRWIDPAGVIHRLAGGGQLNVTNGVAAKDAKLLGPEGLVYDQAGNLYVAEYDGHRVDKIDPNGMLTIVAGTGTAGNDGDGGAATAAHLNAPNWLTLDPQGNLVIVDSGNHNVRRVTPSGVISTIVGTGQPTNDPAVTGYLPSQPTRPLGDGGPATAATLNTPTTAIYDRAGTLLVTDSMNYAVRRVTPDGIIRTVAGTWQTPDASTSAIPNGTPALQVPISAPDGMAIAPSGNVYFSEYAGYRVRMLTY